jgi:hypothetical protein
VLLPFLALDRGRLRPRMIIVTVVTVTLGLALSFFLWGPSTLSPLTFAATRRSNAMSIFCFLRGRYSPLWLVRANPNIDFLAPIVLFVALMRAWSWYRVRHPDIETAGLVAVTTTVLFYHTGFPQYHMVPFALGAAWVVGRWDVLKSRPARTFAVACYFGWIAAFDCYFLISGDGTLFYWQVLEGMVGLPSFVFGCAFLAAVIRSAATDSQPVVRRPKSGDAVGARLGPA